MKQPHIAIIVLHYKNLEDTKNCLKSIQKSDYQNHSVVIVNNDSLEHGKILQDEFAEFDFIQNSKNLGFAEGNNIGIRRALSNKKTEVVFILNNDTALEPDCLDKLAKINSDMLSPRMIQMNNKDKIDNLGITLMSSGLPFNRLNENQKLFCPSAGAALYSRRLLEAVSLSGRNDQLAVPTKNYFDSDYFAYAEDLDLGFRARLAGFRAEYAADAIVYHKGSGATSKLSDFAIYHTYRNLVWTQFKNLPASLLLWQSPWLAFGWIAIFAFYILKLKPGLILKSFLEGIIYLPFQIKKRKQIQKNKKISNKEILNLFENGLFPKNLLKP